MFDTLRFMHIIIHHSIWIAIITRRNVLQVHIWRLALSLSEQWQTLQHFNNVGEHTLLPPTYCPHLLSPTFCPPQYALNFCPLTSTPYLWPYLPPPTTCPHCLPPTVHPPTFCMWFCSVFIMWRRFSATLFACTWRSSTTRGSIGGTSSGLCVTMLGDLQLRDAVNSILSLSVFHKVKKRNYSTSEAVYLLTLHGPNWTLNGLPTRHYWRPNKYDDTNSVGTTQHSTPVTRT